MICSIIEECKRNPKDSGTSMDPQTYKKNISTPNLSNHTIGHRSPTHKWKTLEETSSEATERQEQGRRREVLRNLFLQRTTAERTRTGGDADMEKVWIGGKAAGWLS